MFDFFLWGSILSVKWKGFSLCDFCLSVTRIYLGHRVVGWGRENCRLDKWTAGVLWRPGSFSNLASSVALIPSIKEWCFLRERHRSIAAFSLNSLRLSFLRNTDTLSLIWETYSLCSVDTLRKVKGLISGFGYLSELIAFWYREGFLFHCLELVWQIVKLAQ